MEGVITELDHVHSIGRQASTCPNPSVLPLFCSRMARFSRFEDAIYLLPSSPRARFELKPEIIVNGRQAQ